MANFQTEAFDRTNGVALTSGDSAVITTVTTSGTSAAVYSTSIKHEGTASAHFTSTTGTRACEYTDASTATDRYYSFFIYPHATPSGNTVVLAVGASAGSLAFTCSLNADRTVKINAASGLIIGTTTTSTAPVDEWSRIDVSLVGSTVSLAFYPGTAHCDDAVGTAIANDTKSGATVPPTNPLRYQTLGLITSRINDVYFDGFRSDTTTLPGPFGGTSATVTPSVVAAVAGVPAPTVVAVSNAAVAPAVVAMAAMVPTAIVPVVVRPTAVAAVAAVPTPTVSSATSVNVTPSVVAAVGAIPAPAIPTIVSPATVAAVAAIPALTALVSVTLSPDLVVAVTAIPAVAVSATTHATATPSRVAAVANVPAVTITVTSTAPMTSVAAVVGIPSVTVLVQGNTTVFPATVAAVAGVPAVSVVTAAVPSPSAVAVTVTIAGVNFRATFVLPDGRHAPVYLFDGTAAVIRLADRSRLT